MWITSDYEQELLVAFLLLDSKLLNGHNLKKIVTEKGSMLAFKPSAPQPINGGPWVKKKQLIIKAIPGTCHVD